jgi:hypothetical protein
MRKVVEQNRFKPFWVGGEEVPISILQYADDTLCISEATVDNLWALKTILRGFEMASGLKVNFWKSCIVGVNVPEEFLDIATGLLNCRRGHMPIKYLGLPVGANPRKMSTWEPMLAAIRGRLGAWGNKYVCLGGAHNVDKCGFKCITNFLFIIHENTSASLERGCENSTELSLGWAIKEE